ncbi:type II toxin-antitoxin system RelE family toxin [Streptomyces sp. H51]|uniref:type II toxin-antitoxin system RelE family toxin n=1 Tax=Streptomyces sp. H51 TaxID=3111770 RepID=UPI002D79E679|nr:type II toxin-antitoxin system RelE/ParE family toxin [Streptomyces sp. H51]
MDAGDTTALDVEALQGRSARWRIRVGDHRVVHTVEDGQLIVWVLAVGNRRDLYRKVPLAPRGAAGARAAGVRPGAGRAAGRCPRRRPWRS